MNENDRQLSEVASKQRPEGMPPLFRIDNTGAASGLIIEHLTETLPVPPRRGPVKTLCGRTLYMTQAACGNSPCKRCLRIAGVLRWIERLP